MKKQILMIIISLACWACDGKKETKNEQKELADSLTRKAESWQDFDVSKTLQKFPIIVKVPQKFTYNDSLAFLGLQIEGEKFKYTVDEWPESYTLENLKDFKKELETDKSAVVFESYLLNKPDGYIAKVGGISSGYVIMRLVKIGEKTYQMSVVPLYALQTEEDAKALYEQMGKARVK
jgi:hypothetical protein